MVRPSAVSSASIALRSPRPGRSHRRRWSAFRRPACANGSAAHAGFGPGWRAGRPWLSHPIEPCSPVDDTAPLFFAGRATYTALMSIFSGWGAPVRGLFNDNKGPWGSSEPGDGRRRAAAQAVGRAAEGPQDAADRRWRRPLLARRFPAQEPRPLGRRRQRPAGTAGQFDDRLGPDRRRRRCCCCSRPSTPSRRASAAWSRSSAATPIRSARASG